jgi:hypothetical protein
MMLLGVTIVPGVVGLLMFVIGTPSAGLAVWGHRDDGDDGGDSPLDCPAFDWDAFERGFQAYARRHGRSSRSSADSVGEMTTSVGRVFLLDHRPVALGSGRCASRRRLTSSLAQSSPA